VRGRRLLRRLWLSNSGEWQWLVEKPAKIATLNRLLWRESVPSLSFFTMLSLSGVISTLGLLAGSTATIIGAMIIAPLMGPIIGIAYSLAIANRRLLKRATLTLIFGIVATVGSAAIIAWVIQLRTLNPEIVARSHPTLIDLGVALAAGAAGAFAKSRKHIADAFPGVAIAVALVPPLSVIGIGIALGMPSVWTGASLLFLTNLTAIIFSGIVVFLWQRYGSIERAQGGLAFSLVILVILGIPLGLSLRKLLLQSTVRQQVSSLIRDELETFPDADIQGLTISNRDGILVIQLELAAQPDSIQPEQIRLARQFLEQELRRPVTLKVRITPIQQFEEFAPDS
jgi:uncharacterized hydrophobic protein (TIGR00271 family)